MSAVPLKRPLNYALFLFCWFKRKIAPRPIKWGAIRHEFMGKRKIEKVKGGKAYAFFKRFFDLFLSLLGFALIAWLFAILAIVVKLSSPGPILFKDKRVGKNYKEIEVYKFRTMYIDAESNIDKYLTPEQKETWERERKLDNDPRITKIGRFMRKTSLDELPQILNVIGGSISLVGPRPITKREIEENFTKEQADLMLSAKPGITGYWQVYGRSDASFASGERQKLTIEYFSKRSLWLDFKILLLTIPAVLKHKGAK